MAAAIALIKGAIGRTVGPAVDAPSADTATATAAANRRRSHARRVEAIATAAAAPTKITAATPETTPEAAAAAATEPATATAKVTATAPTRFNGGDGIQCQQSPKHQWREAAQGRHHTMVLVPFVVALKRSAASMLQLVDAIRRWNPPVDSVIDWRWGVWHRCVVFGSHVKAVRCGHHVDGWPYRVVRLARLWALALRPYGSIS
jgi:hypothetical protein